MGANGFAKLRFNWSKYEILTIKFKCMIDRPTKIHVEKINNKYSITCVDELTGSGIGIDLPINGYLALKEHFKTGAMDVSSDEIGKCNLDNVIN